MKRLLLALAAILILPMGSDAQVVVDAQETLDPASIEFRDMSMKKTKGTTRVMIPRVSISFVTKSAFAESEGRALSKSVLQSALGLSGMSDADFQSITDQAHDLFVSELEAAGFEVVPFDALEADEAYADLGLSDDPVGEEQRLSRFWDSLSKISGATHARTYVAHGRPNFTPGSAARRGNFMRYAKMGKRLDATTAQLEMTLEFVQYRADKKTVWTGGGYGSSPFGTEISIESRPVLFPSYVYAKFVTPKMIIASLEHKKPSRVPAVAGAYAVDLREAGGAWDTGMRKGRKDYLEVVANPDSYREVALANIHTYIRAIVAELSRQANR